MGVYGKTAIVVFIVHVGVVVVEARTRDWIHEAIIQLVPIILTDAINGEPKIALKVDVWIRELRLLLPVHAPLSEL